MERPVIGTLSHPRRGPPEVAWARHGREPVAEVARALWKRPRKREVLPGGEDPRPTHVGLESWGAWEGVSGGPHVSLEARVPLEDGSHVAGVSWGREVSGEAAGSHVSLEVGGKEVSLEIVGSHGSLELVGIEVSLEADGSHVPLELVGIEVPLEPWGPAHVSLEAGGWDDSLEAGPAHGALGSARIGSGPGEILGELGVGAGEAGAVGVAGVIGPEGGVRGVAGGEGDGRAKLGPAVLLGLANVPVVLVPPGEGRQLGLVGALGSVSNLVSGVVAAAGGGGRDGGGGVAGRGPGVAGVLGGGCGPALLGG